MSPQRASLGRFARRQTDCRAVFFVCLVVLHLCISVQISAQMNDAAHDAFYSKIAMSSMLETSDVMRFNSEEHRSLCGDAASQIDAPLGIVLHHGQTDKAGPFFLRIKKIHCVKHEEWGHDEIELRVSADAELKGLLHHDFKTGETWTLDGKTDLSMIPKAFRDAAKNLMTPNPTASYVFDRQVRLTLVERDRGMDANIDADDVIGSKTISVNTKTDTPIEFKSGDGHYKVYVAIEPVPKKADGTLDIPDEYEATIVSIKCVDQEDWTGDDSLMVRVSPDGQRIEPFRRDIDEGETFLPKAATYKFRSSLQIKLIEEDVEGDDNLGTETLRPPFKDGESLHSLKFDEDGADYRVTVRVTNNNNKNKKKEEDLSWGTDETADKEKEKEEEDAKKIARVRMKSLRCLIQNEGSDEIELQVMMDGKLEDRFEEEGVGMGWIHKFDESRWYTYREKASFTLTEVDSGHSAMDADDDLGTRDLAAFNTQLTKNGEQKLSFTKNGAKYVLTVEVQRPDGLLKTTMANSVFGRMFGGSEFLQESQTWLPPRRDRNKAMSTYGPVPLAKYGNGEFLDYADLCALCGDFFVGSDKSPQNFVIGYDIATNKPRPDAASDAMFLRVFNDWNKRLNDQDSFRKRVRNLLGLMDKERGSFARHMGKPYSIALAYHEDELGLTTIDHVTNSHESNYAKVTEGGEPDIPYHYGTATELASLWWRNNSPYLRGASYNFDHFRESGAIEAWKAGHRMAIREACKAGKIGDSQKKAAALARAIAMNAHADHFGTDQFAAGHMRTPRRDLFKKYIKRCNPALMKPSAAVGLAAKLMHDEDNFVGLPVKNKHAEWVAYGDANYNYNGNAENRKQAIEFVKKSLTDVMDAFNGNCACEEPISSGESDTCIGRGLNQETGPLSYIPEIIESRAHAPLWKVDPENSKNYLYRETGPFDTVKYTSWWACGWMVAPGWHDIPERNDHSTEMKDRVMERQSELQRVFFNQMDTDRDGQVHIDEFVAWTKFAVPDLNTHKDELVEVYVVNLFEKFLGEKRTVLQPGDLDRMLHVNTQNKGGLVTFEQFVTTEMRVIVKEHETQVRSAFEQQLTMSSTAVAAGVGSVSAGLKAASSRTDLVKSFWDTFQKLMGGVLVSENKIAANKYDAMMSGLKDRKIVPQDAGDADIAFLTEFQLQRARLHVNFTRLAKKDHPTVVERWRSIAMAAAVINSMQPNKNQSALDRAIPSKLLTSAKSTLVPSLMNAWYTHAQSAPEPDTTGPPGPDAAGAPQGAPDHAGDDSSRGAPGVDGPSGVGPSAEVARKWHKALQEIKKTQSHALATWWDTASKAVKNEIDVSGFLSPATGVRTDSNLQRTMRRLTADDAAAATAGGVGSIGAADTLQPTGQPRF
jgi:hypothetical protein